MKNTFKTIIAAAIITLTSTAYAGTSVSVGGSVSVTGSGSAWSYSSGSASSFAAPTYSYGGGSTGAGRWSSVGRITSPSGSPSWNVGNMPGSSAPAFGGFNPTAPSAVFGGASAVPAFDAYPSSPINEYFRR